MKVLLTTNGSRGDVQPILALAVELQALGHHALICAAPNFQTWVESFGVRFISIGPDLEKWTRPAGDAPKIAERPSPEQMRQLVYQSVSDQFRVLTEAAQGYDLIVVGGLLQVAGRSVAELLKIPYVYAAYCPATLPSPDHPPIKVGVPHSQSLSPSENRALWVENENSFNDTFRDALNKQRQHIGLSAVKNTSRHVSTDDPWLAADPVLAPADSPIDMQITQTGAWLLSDPNPLPDTLERFLAEGEPPLYLGFGSMRADGQTSRILIEAARALGRRAIISHGWGHLGVIDDGTDCISIGSVNHARLFPRVAAVAHHGGAGTTTAAARSGKPQIIMPHVYDQYYWADRVQTLGVGVYGPKPVHLTVDALATAIHESLKPQVASHAQALSTRIELQGARIAAEKLIAEFA